MDRQEQIKDHVRKRVDGRATRAAIDSILESIESETQQSQPSNDRIRSLAQDTRKLLRKRQKLIT